MMRVLFVSTYPELGPSARYRIVQFLEPLKKLGVEGDFLPLFTNAFYSSFHKPGNYLYKGAYLAARCLGRLKEAFDARRYDVVFVQREAALIGPPFFELLARYVARRPIVFDLDDAIFHNPADTKQASAHPRLRRLLKDPNKAERIAQLSSAVIGANSYTSDWAKKFCSNVTTIPTVVDGDQFSPRFGQANAVPVIGWIGSHSAAPQLDVVVPALEQLAEKHRFRVKLVGAGREFPIRGVEVENLPWKLEREVEDFKSLDIGVCPLFDDQWSRGKPGFKPLIYMACGVPQVSTPLGGVTELMKDGEQGFFAMRTEDWYEKLDRLLGDEPLRRDMAGRARATFEAGPSLQTEAPRLAEVLAQAVRPS
jgi:glycosyltransferase involved in cell wall biosynthesis